MKPQKRISYFDDPVGYQEQEREKARYLADLFHPIYGFALEPNTEWIVKEFLPRGYLAILAAEPKAGKTCFATSLALSVATGADFGGLPTHQGAVLWVAGEESPEERSLYWKEAPLADAGTPLYTCYEHIAIDTDEGIWALEEWIGRVEATLIVIDPLHAATSGRSLQDGWAARKTLAKLKKMCAVKRVACVVLHHSSRKHRGRTNGVAESAQLSATASLLWLLSSRPVHQEPASEEEGRLVTIECRGRGSFANRIVQFSSSSPLAYHYMGAKVEHDPALPRNTASVKMLRALAVKPMTASQMVEHVPGCRIGTIRNVLCSLLRSNTIKVVRKRKGVRTYALTNCVKVNVSEESQTQNEPEIVVESGSEAGS